jgi:protein TonB
MYEENERLLRRGTSNYFFAKIIKVLFFFVILWYQVVIMEVKKTEKADLENKKVLFTMIGLVFSLGLTLLAFEWKSYEKLEVHNFQYAAIAIEEDIIIQTEQNLPTAPPPPPQTIVADLNIVGENALNVQDFDFNAEADEGSVNTEYSLPHEAEESEAAESRIFVAVEENAGYPGGETARQKFLSDNIKYPSLAKEVGIQGVIYVTFVVERDGSLSNIKILKGIGGGCDEEAIRVVKLMPKWISGKQRGKSVRCQFNMPIKFTLAG